MSYTQGPWKVLPEEVHKDYIRIRGDVLGGRYKVANVLSPIYEGVNDREAEETRSNANLIAAAPELLEAIESLMDKLSCFESDAKLLGTGWNSEMIESLRNVEDVVSKAKGEQ